MLRAGIRDILAMSSKNICHHRAGVLSPIGYFITEMYFSSIAYHMAICLWVFAVALIVVLVVIEALVVARCLGAVTRNPMESIKSEYPPPQKNLRFGQHRSGDCYNL